MCVGCSTDLEKEIIFQEILCEYTKQDEVFPEQAGICSPHLQELDPWLGIAQDWIFCFSDKVQFPQWKLSFSHAQYCKFLACDGTKHPLME